MAEQSNPASYEDRPERRECEENEEFLQALKRLTNFTYNEHSEFVSVGKSEIYCEVPAPLLGAKELSYQGCSIRIHKKLHKSDGTTTYSIKLEHYDETKFEGSLLVGSDGALLALDSNRDADIKKVSEYLNASYLYFKGQKAEEAVLGFAEKLEELEYARDMLEALQALQDSAQAAGEENASDIDISEHEGPGGRLIKTVKIQMPPETPPSHSAVDVERAITPEKHAEIGKIKVVYSETRRGGQSVIITPYRRTDNSTVRSLGVTIDVSPEGQITDVTTQANNLLGPYLLVVHAYDYYSGH